jgi:protein-disulfide isomerase
MDQKNPYLLPVAILAGGVILAGAVYITRSGALPLAAEGDITLLAPVSPQDHIIGNPEAPVKIVEYSDIDCEYCKSYQATISQLMSEYGPQGQVAWVYRHFPLVSVHGFAATHAEAAECLAEQGGDELFFSFIDALNQAAPGASQFDPAGYPSVVDGLGANQKDLDGCLASDRMIPRVTDNFENALAIGATATPYVVVTAPGKEPVTIAGALPYDDLKAVVEQALAP